MEVRAARFTAWPLGQVFAEYSEEYPLLMSKPAMCTLVRNYYKKASPSDTAQPKLAFGVTAVLGIRETSPFLGQIRKGTWWLLSSSLQTFWPQAFAFESSALPFPPPPPSSACRGGGNRFPFAHASACCLAGETQTSFENNLFRAPAFQHAVEPTDFLVVRRSDELYVRRVPVVFVVGQQMPKVWPGLPHSPCRNSCCCLFIRRCNHVLVLLKFSP
jgi:hypothetical protein